MKIHYVMHAESHTKRCADLVLAMAMLRIVPVDIKHFEDGVIKWTFKDHAECYRILRKIEEMTPDL